MSGFTTEIAGPVFYGPSIYQFSAVPAQDWGILALFQTQWAGLSSGNFPVPSIPFENHALAYSQGPYARWLCSPSGTGAVKIDTGWGTITLNLAAYPAGKEVLVMCSKIYQTGTTCADLVVIP
jgi:hypothetical protein